MTSLLLPYDASAFTLWVGGRPVPKGSWTAYRSKAGRTNFVGPKGLVAWQKALHEAAALAWEGGPTSRPVSLMATFYLPRYKTAYRPYPSGLREGDVDKYLRAVMDALTGIVYVDDSQVCWACAAKVYDDDPGRGTGVLISVQAN
jgi:Holliday junction resolvase RusA-like endonuclease